MNLNKTRIVAALLWGALCISCFTIIYQNRVWYTTFNYWENFAELKRVFLNSQYVNKHATGYIPDETAYSYAGGALIQGTSPILVLPEAPPLGKYMIGLSAVLFNNPNIIIMLVCGVLGLVYMYLIGKQIYHSKITALVAVLLLTLEPLYRNQFAYVPLFDIAQVFFLLASLYYFTKSHISEKHPLRYLIIAQIFVGLFISTKFYMSGLTILGAFFLVLLYNKDGKRMKYLILTSIIPVIILYATYIRVLIIGYPFNKFLGIQRWIFNFWTGKLNLPFTVWALVFANQWYVWWGDQPILSDSQWRLTWPLVTALSFLTVGLYLFKHLSKKKELEVLLAYSVTYGAFASIGQTSARYLVIYLPVLYLVAFYLVETYVRRALRRTQV